MSKKLKRWLIIIAIIISLNYALGSTHAIRPDPNYQSLNINIVADKVKIDGVPKYNNFVPAHIEVKRARVFIGYKIVWSDKNDVKAVRLTFAQRIIYKIGDRNNG